VLLFLTAATTPGLETFPFGAIMLLVLSTAALTALSQVRQGSAQSVDESATVAAREPVREAADERA
jgi:hypothetical protein